MWKSGVQAYELHLKRVFFAAAKKNFPHRREVGVASGGGDVLLNGALTPYSHYWRLVST